MMLIVLFLIFGFATAQSPPPGFGGPPAHCRPLTGCSLTCQYRLRRGPDGCDICQCSSTPCINETAIIPNVECDRTTNGPKCPSTHDCVVSWGGGPPPSAPGSPPPSPRPTPPPTTRGVCCIHVDFGGMGMGPRPPPRRLLDVINFNIDLYEQCNSFSQKKESF